MNHLMFPNAIPAAKRAVMAGLLALSILGCQSSTDADRTGTAAEESTNDVADANVLQQAARGTLPEAQVKYKPGPLARYTLHSWYPVNTTLNCRESVRAAYKDLEKHLYGDWRDKHMDDLVIAYWPIYMMIQSQCNPR
jgi:hypothetical protein